MRHQLSFVLTEKAEQVELVRRQMDELPVAATERPSRSISSGADVKDLLARRRRTAKHRAQARKQLRERNGLTT